ncbi:MAG TPA: sensor histidine kinase [Vicinamibacterales bacterium]|nr:sensor histidine kinase [Vicinamibacterales bacterium]
MLYEFVITYRDDIIKKAREKLTARPWPSASANELENGVPLFLGQLAETLEAEESGSAFTGEAIGEGATRHGRDLLALGFTVSQVVHDYGDICQAVTELAIEQNAPITTEEFHTLNRCLDTAIAEAVTEHARLTAASKTPEDLARAGQLAHDIQNTVDSAILAFGILKRGAVAVNGSTGMVLGRNLMSLKDLVGSALSDIRLGARQHRRELVSVQSFLSEIAVAAGLHAEYLGLHFALEPVDSAWVINVDTQLLGSAVTNLLNNAFKYTRAGGHVALRAHNEDGTLQIEVEDECGGIPDIEGDPLRRGLAAGESHSSGLGLSIAQNAVSAQEGDISIRNMPGRGCVFIIALALAAEPLPGTAATQ